MSGIISVMRLKKNGSFVVQVTRRFPDLRVADTKWFDEIEQALQQVREWLMDV